MIKTSRKSESHKLKSMVNQWVFRFDLEVVRIVSSLNSYGGFILDEKICEVFWTTAIQGFFVRAAVS